MLGVTRINAFLTGLFTVPAIFLLSVSGQAQVQQPVEKCGIEYYEKWKQTQAIPAEDDRQFEQWISRKITERRSRTLSAGKIQEVVTLPVVVHVVHNGEPVGVGSNLSDEQILSQIEVLNQDFRRNNPDRDNTPDDFLPVAADTEIEFALARRDPEGLPTNGIVRVDGGQSDWELVENFRLKQLSYWPAEDYINIWVTNMGSNFLGYAQFPVSPLEGLELGSANALTDGIVVDFMVFGSEAIYPEANLIPAYNLGRTTSHEIGHYLGLRHIWGDGDCSEDDFVNDTPAQSTDHGGLGFPCAYPGPNTCGTGAGDLPDMFQNYMDYTNDVCMNLFTVGQKERMLVVLENSPRRRSLLQSKGAEPPIAVANDAGIRSLPNATVFLCNELVLPEAEIRNYGTNVITSVTMRLLIDNMVAETRTFSVNLNPLDTRTVTFNPVNVGAIGDHEFEYIIEMVNGLADANSDNDVKAYTATLLPSAEGSLSVDFETSLPGQWTIINPDDLVEWEITSAYLETATNQALYMNFFEYELEGETDLFISPVIDLTDAAGPFLTFDLSHARYPGNNDGLLITATNVCGDPYFESDTLYYKTGAELATVSGTRTRAFFPESADDWRTESIDLSAYTGTEVRLAFIAINGYGNNLFIDNIRFDPGAVISLSSPGLVTCGPEVPLTFTIQNNLSSSLSAFELRLGINGTETVYDIRLNPPLPAGDSYDLTLPPLSLADGDYLLEAGMENINESGMDPPGKSSVSQYLYVDSDQDILPLREDFDLNERWTMASRDGQPEWTLLQTNYGRSASIDFTTLEENEPLQWLVSPDLDLTAVATPYLVFDYAYAQQSTMKDQLWVYVSTDCGLTYEPLTSIFLDGSGIPNNESNWRREIIPLEILAGIPDVRVALVAESRQAGIIFLDNIQIFVNEPVVFAEQLIYPNPAVDGRFNITVNLEQRQNATLRIINMHGQVILKMNLENTLNQTFPVDLSDRASGVYLVELRGETFSLIKRVVNTR